GGTPLRLVGRGPGDHAGLRDGCRGWSEGAGGKLITWIVVITLALLVVVFLLVGLWAFQTANRLDRLHVGYDLSWQALDGLLARRAVVARAVAVDAYGGGPDGKRLAALADAAERAPRTARGAAENELSPGRAPRDPRGGPRRPGVAAGGTGRRARRRGGAGVAGASLPQRRRPRHPCAARTARGADPAPRRNGRAANLFRDRRTRGGVAAGSGFGQPA